MKDGDCSQAGNQAAHLSSLNCGLYSSCALTAQEENMVSNAELREKYTTPQDYEEDFM
jgi:hypothetical protein